MLIKTQILNLVAADHPTLQNEDTIRQIESKLQKSEQHLQDMASQNVKLRYELGRLKEVYGDVQERMNLRYQLLVEPALCTLNFL